MANKAQKPAGQLQYKREGRAERRTLRVVQPDEPRKVPRPPKTLTGIGRVVWRAYWSDSVSLAASEVDLYDIHRYCHLIERREALEASIAETPTVRNEYGEQPHPKFKIIRELSREIEKTREHLGILPLAKMRLGLVTVQAEHGRRSLPPKPKREDRPGVLDLDAL